ncbi:hypothetical protein Y032_0027g1605 [Ancylostoma ceylanicum]|uniref:Uncharacterized protein n=1 Tax=Ancylostoma ceylanicum TaxID=53326 RepID=A0A016UVX7_9BILA|nr:hypothetical protein Y032_0027g1605 [Ancylostoma ceylanicum]
MKKVAVLLVALVLSVAAQRKCDAESKCPPGLVCRNGNCVRRMDCPQISMPRPDPGCKLVPFIDERDCPKMKVVCDKAK